MVCLIENIQGMCAQINTVELIERTKQIIYCSLTMCVCFVAHNVLHVRIRSALCSSLHDILSSVSSFKPIIYYKLINLTHVTMQDVTDKCLLFFSTEDLIKFSKP